MTARALLWSEGLGAGVQAVGVCAAALMPNPCARLWTPRVLGLFVPGAAGGWPVLFLCHFIQESQGKCLSLSMSVFKIMSWFLRILQAWSECFYLLSDVSNLLREIEVWNLPGAAFVVKAAVKAHLCPVSSFSALLKSCNS